MAPFDVFVLCGGLGTRLRTVSGELPKVLVPVGKKPFLEVVLDSLATAGFRRIILGLGYKSDVIRQRFERYSKAELLFSEETEPLGTAGAIKNAASLLRSSPFFALNGDSYCNLAWGEFLSAHQKNRAIASIVLTPARNRTDGGYVAVNSKGRITGFGEKEYDPSRYLSAGFYAFEQSILDDIPAGKSSSLERDVFPALKPEHFFGFVSEEPIYDIGTPERLDVFRRIQT